MIILRETLGVYRGMGRHIALYGPEGVRNYFLNLFVGEILYTIALCLTKFSVLLFYVRIFGKSNIGIPVIIIGSIVACWGVAVVSRAALPQNSLELIEKILGHR